MIIPGSSHRNRKRQTGEQGTDSKETGPGDLQPKLPKTTASTPQPRRLANTSDLTAVVWAHHWSHHTLTQLDGLSLLKCKMPCQKATILQAMSKPVSVACTFKGAARTSWAHYIRVALECLFSHTQKVNNHLRMQFYQLFIS